MYYKPTKFKQNRYNRFLKNRNLNFFLCELPLILRVDRKKRKKERKKERKRETGNICKGTPDIEFEQDWPVGLDATLHDRQKIKNYFSSFKDFLGKADSVMLLDFEPAINLENLIKIVRFVIEKIQILILKVGQKLKYGLDMFRRGPYISNLNETDQLV